MVTLTRVFNVFAGLPERCAKHTRVLQGVLRHRRMTICSCCGLYCTHFTARSFMRLLTAATSRVIAIP